MPRYDVYCKVCGNELEIFRRVKDFDDRPFCCNEKMWVKIHPVLGMVENISYKSMLTGEMITSKHRHTTHLRDHGCVEVGNEPIKPQKKFERTKQECYRLRKEISERLSCAGV